MISEILEKVAIKLPKITLSCIPNISIIKGGDPTKLPITPKTHKATDNINVIVLSKNNINIIPGKIQIKVTIP